MREGGTPLIRPATAPADPGVFGASRECALAGGVPPSADADPGENKDDPPARGEPSSLAAALLSFWCQLGVRPPLPGGVLGPLSSLLAGEPTTSPRALASDAFPSTEPSAPRPADPAANGSLRSTGRNRGCDGSMPVAVSAFCATPATRGLGSCASSTSCSRRWT